MLNHCMHMMWYNNAKLWERNKHEYDTIMQYDGIGDLLRFKTYPYICWIYNVFQKIIWSKVILQFLSIHNY